MNPFKKTAITLLGSLVATALFAFLVSMVCRSGTSDGQKGSLIASAEAAPVNKTLAGLQLENAFPNLTFDLPVEFTHAGDGSGRVFVIEQDGRIRVFNNNASVKSADVYLDIRNRVASGGEMGLLGLAFHPNFKQNGYFFVNYTKDNPRKTVISRFKVSPTANRVDPSAETILLKFRQPYANHNGGKVAFGPDGMLYIATGDGGSGGDPHNNGQSLRTYLAKILRIDVDKTDKGHYGIPTDNPFVKTEGALPEIYAYGLRNPWRFSFDAQTGQLWTGDVGQNEIEEIDIVTKGGNYGWRLKEARQCYNPKSNCNEGQLIDPIHQYPHSEGISVTGGYVYRGKSIPALQGKYIYGDFGMGKIWALSYQGNKETGNQLLTSQAGAVSAFGEDANRELYVLDHSGGKIKRFVVR